MKNKKILYIEPSDYIPEELRKEYKIGEYYTKETLDKENDSENKKDSL
ncbi:MAG: hypothetical protein IJ944_03345 [Clostridia bacterium]|nr:hypothetical protein [Clostridia bacterium]